MSKSIKISGLDKLQKKLKANATLDDVKKVVKTNGTEMNAKAQRNASFKGHYENGKFVSPTGATKRSIVLEVNNNGMNAKSAPSTEYAPYLENGTRFMAAQPFMKPAFNEQKEVFKRDMDRLVK